jgi:hypothetical protein
MIVYYLNAPDQYLYHYTKAEKLIGSILPNNSLRMSQLSQTNDPRETKNWTFGHWTRRAFTEESDAEWEALEKESTLAKERFKVVCFATDTPNAVPWKVDHIWERGYCRPRMWAQYADNDEGVCLLFDRAEFRSRIQASLPAGTRIFETYVSYKNTSQAPRLDRTSAFILDYDALKTRGSEQTIATHVARYWKELFFEKASDWSHECEYRYLFWDHGNGGHLVPFGTSLKGIVLGAEFPEARLHELKPFSDRLNFDVWKMRWRNGVPEVVPILLVSP